jgi:hypothetical protein
MSWLLERTRSCKFSKQWNCSHIWNSISRCSWPLQHTNCSKSNIYLSRRNNMCYSYIRDNFLDTICIHLLQDKNWICKLSKTYLELSRSHYNTYNSKFSMSKTSICPNLNQDINRPGSSSTLNYWRHNLDKA